jgi:hypothetical protein
MFAEEGDFVFFGHDDFIPKRGAYLVWRWEYLKVDD